MSDDSLPSAFGPAVLCGVIRQQPEDFIVHEQDAFSASGSGEHLLLRLEKRGLNTVFVAERLARWAGVARSAIGYAGLKDRHALTTQRFSVWLPKRQSPDPALLQGEGLRLLEQHWHSRKLARGALAGNRFELTLRQVQGAPEAIQARLQQIARRGVPNAFGEQRFGHAGGNLEAARALFSGRRFPREKRSLLLSAARSALFNRMLGERIRNHSWDQALPGDVFMLDGSHSLFGPLPLDEDLIRRLDEADIHPTGALWGAGALRSQAQVQALENAVAEADPQLAEGLAAAGLKQERRALRVMPKALQWQWQGDSLRLHFELPPGSYATAVLHALGPVHDAATACIAS